MRGVPWRARLAGLPVLAFVAAYYRWRWPHLHDYVVAIDHCEELFCDFTQHFHPMGATFLAQKRPVPGYFYSAFFAVLLVPFGSLPASQAVWAWGLLQVALTAVLFAIPFDEFIGASPLATSVYTFAFATSLPLLHNFKWGQASVLVVASVLGSFAARRRGRPAWAGIWLALGASIKYYPAIFALYYLLKREFRLLAWFAASAAIFLLVVPAPFLGIRDHLRFEHIALSEAQAAFWVHTDVNSQFVSHVLARNAPGLGMVEGGLLWNAIRAAIVCGSLALVWATTRRRIAHEAALAASILFLTTPFLLETSWPHYFAYLPFCQLALVGGSRSHSTVVRGFIVGAAAISALLASIFALDRFADWNSYSTYGVLFASNGLLLVAGYVLVLASRQGQPAALADQPPHRGYAEGGGAAPGLAGFGGG